MAEHDPDRSGERGHRWVREVDQSESLEDGFVDHGSVGFRTNSRGWVSTHDGDDHDVVLVWLCDESGGWLGMIDVDAREFEEFSPRGLSVRAPFASLLSSRNRFYACNHHFVEFDPVRREFTFVEEDVDDGDSLAMSMTEDDEGVIWVATYPDATVVSYDPDAGELREYGPAYEHPSSMYPRSIAADDRGWIYVGLEPAAGQLLVLDRESGAVTPVLSVDETVSDGEVSVTRDRNGRVYGRAGDRWFELYDGEAAELDAEPAIDEKPIVAGPQSLRHRALPSGRRVAELALGQGDPYLAVEDPETGATTRVSFDPSGGDVVPMRLTAAPDGSIVGGTGLPMQLFRYVPDSDEWFKTNNVGQWNVVASADGHVYAGHYPAGALLRWDPTADWDPPEENERDLDSNPAFLAGDSDDLHRPFSLLVHPDGRHVIMGGQPDYGHAGGGLLFWNRRRETAEVLTHEAVLEGHITRSLAALSDGTLLGGTDVRPALGGVREADVAKLYLMDVEDREVLWSAAPLPGVERYQDLAELSDGNVAGVADRNRLFVLDPERRAVVHEAEMDEEFVDHQGPHVFVEGPDDRLFVLFAGGTIAELDPETYELTPLAQSPAGIRNGGASLDGRIYFATDTDVYSWEVPSAR